MREGVVHMHLVASFVLRAGGQNDITIVAGRVPMRVHNEVKIAELKQFANAFWLTQTRKGIRGMRENNTRFIRLLRLECFKYARVA